MVVGGVETLHFRHLLQSFFQPSFPLRLPLLAPPPPQLQVVVADDGVLNQGEKNGQKGGKKVHVNRLQVADARKVRVGIRHQGGHCEDGGHAEGHPGVVVVPVEPEGHPADDDDEEGRDVDLRDVVADGAGEVEVRLQAAVVSGAVALRPPVLAVAEQAEGGQVDFRVKGDGRIGRGGPAVHQLAVEEAVYQGKRSLLIRLIGVIRRGLLTTRNLQRTPLLVHRKEGQVHRAANGSGHPRRVRKLAVPANAEHRRLLAGHRLLRIELLRVFNVRVRQPDLLDELLAEGNLVKAVSDGEGQPRVVPVVANVDVDLVVLKIGENHLFE